MSATRIQPSWRAARSKREEQSRLICRRFQHGEARQSRSRFLDCAAVRVPRYRAHCVQLSEIITGRFLLKEILLMNKKHEAIRNWSEMFMRPRRTPRPDSQVAVLLCSLAFLGAVSVSAQTRKIELNDYAKITSVSDPQISPDGKTIVFVVSRPNLEQDRRDNELVAIDIATGSQRVLTYERKGAGSPRWSPAGDRLAFVAAAGAEKNAKPQVFVLPMMVGEARKITRPPI